MHFHAQEGDKKSCRRIVGQKPVRLMSSRQDKRFRLTDVKVSCFFPHSGFFLFMRGKTYNLEPLRPGLFYLKGGLNFVENALGQVKTARLPEQDQAMGLVKMDDRTGIADDGFHLAA